MIGAVRKTEHAGETILSMTAAYRKAAQTKAAYERMKTYWEQKVNVSYHTKDRRFDRYMQWVSFQPILRRIYGCSFCRTMITERRKRLERSLAGLSGTSFDESGRCARDASQ